MRIRSPVFWLWRTNFALLDACNLLQILQLASDCYREIVLRNNCRAERLTPDNSPTTKQLLLRNNLYECGTA